MVGHSKGSLIDVLVEVKKCIIIYIMLFKTLKITV